MIDLLGTKLALDQNLSQTSELYTMAKEHGGEWKQCPVSTSRQQYVHEYIISSFDSVKVHISLPSSNALYSVKYFQAVFNS